MFSPAQEALMNPCLPEAFQKYTAFAGLFALIAVLFTQAIQTAAINHFQKSSTQKVKPIDGEAPENSNRAASHDSIPELGALSLAKAAHDGCCATDAAVLAASHGEHRKITAYILEFGVAIHSVIIGVTLGVTSGTEFTSLLIAILFHQFFEGFALAATGTIMRLCFIDSCVLVLDAGFRGNFHPFILAAIYSVTTPIGVAIGIGVHAIYKENALETLLIQGIMDAISAGILIYDAMVNLMTVEITHSSRYAALSLNQKIGIMLSLWAGAGIMAVIGLWA